MNIKRQCLCDNLVTKCLVSALFMMQRFLIFAILSAGLAFGQDWSDDGDDDDPG